MITSELLRRFAPNCDADVVAPALDAAAHQFGITTSLRVCHWLAQMAVESEGFTVLSENLNYSAEALVREWPRHFPADIAPQYAHQPEKIANRAYANRMGNGDEASGDGWRWRGRGYIDTTGHDGYAALGQAYLANPDLLLIPANAAAAAGKFWEGHRLNGFADEDDVNGVTFVVNGGFTGLAQRGEQLTKAKTIFTAEALGTALAPPPPPPVPVPMIGVTKSGETVPLDATPAPAVLTPALRQTASAIGAGGITIAAAAGGVSLHINMGAVLILALQIVALLAIPFAIWGCQRLATYFHLHMQAKARSELLAILARGSAFARTQGITDQIDIAGAAAQYAVGAAPGLLRTLGVKPEDAMLALTKMALALLPAQGAVQ